MLGHWPAACQVEPEVSSPFSIRTVSEQPSRARWYKRLAPIMPPPTTTTRAFVFIQDLRLGFGGLGHNKLIDARRTTEYFGTFGPKFLARDSNANSSGCRPTDPDVAA